MLTYRDFVKTFQELGLNPQRRVMVHASLSALGEVKGGAETVVGSLIASCGSVITPTFSLRAMVTPPFGPPENAMEYGAETSDEPPAEVFHLDMSVDPECGQIAETLRCHPAATRSEHPLLSFAGVNAEEALELQTLEEPWAPIKWMADVDGDVLLLGVNHTKNVSLHYAEFLVNRKQFLRWALFQDRVVEVPHWPGCADGFQAIAPHLQGVTRLVELGDAHAELIPLRDLINIAAGWMREDPEALLCQRDDCDYCMTIRRELARSSEQ